jgi:hypothetical protein
LPGDFDAKDVILLEDGHDLGPADCPHDSIQAQGRGRYAVWNKFVYFSASDNSDPRANGRCYSLKNVRLLDAAFETLASVTRKLPWPFRSKPRVGLAGSVPPKSSRPHNPDEQSRAAGD